MSFLVFNSKEAARESLLETKIRMMLIDRAGALFS